MDTILVTTDLSKVSESGIKHAVQLSKQMNAKLVFYYVSRVARPTAWSRKKYSLYKETNIERNTVKLKDFVKKATGRKWNLVQNSEFVVGLSLDAGKAIVEFSKERKVTFISMSTHGAGRLRKLVGTNTSYVITKSDVPVFAVPNHYKPKAIKRILFACDFKWLAKELKVVKQLADKLGSKILVCHYESYLDKPDNMQAMRDIAVRHQTKGIMYKFKRIGIKDTFSESLDKDISWVKPGLVVMFTKRNRNWFQKFLTPSKTKQLSYRSPAPMLAFIRK